MKGLTDGSEARYAFLVVHWKDSPPSSSSTIFWISPGSLKVPRWSLSLYCISTMGIAAAKASQCKADCLLLIYKACVRGDKVSGNVLHTTEQMVFVILGIRSLSTHLHQSAISSLKIYVPSAEASSFSSRAALKNLSILFFHFINLLGSSDSMLGHWSFWVISSARKGSSVRR